MSTSAEKSVWASGAAYEPYVGRWSRLVARAFVEWLAIPSAGSWLDVGCGTGALTDDSPAPDYAMSLNDEARTALRERIRAHRPIAADGSIPLIARAWAAPGTR